MTTDRRGVNTEGKSIRSDTTCTGAIVGDLFQCQGMIFTSCCSVEDAADEKRRSRYALCRRDATAECSINMCADSTSQEKQLQYISLKTQSLSLERCRNREADSLVYGNSTASYTLVTHHALPSSVRCRVHGAASRAGES